MAPADIGQAYNRSEPPFITWPVDTPVDQIVGEAIGAASMCWEHVERAGVFDSERASAIVDSLMAALRQKLWADG